MKYKSLYVTFLNCSDEQQVFDYLMNNLLETITFWDYFVSWKKAKNNLKKWERDLHTLNYFLGKDNLEAEFKELLADQPRIASLIPVLLACHDQDFSILTNAQTFEFESFSFRPKNSLSDEEIEKIVRFAKETGLLDIFRSSNIRSLPDYVFGVEVGLDSNGRKNRTGQRMQIIMEQILQSICDSASYKLMSQASAKKIKEAWNYTIETKKSKPFFDFAIDTGTELYLLETNYYSGGGSKLKATAGKYKKKYDELSEQGFGYIWITDGLGWKSARQPLRDAFDSVDYILNIKMVTSGLLAQILAEGL